MHSSKGPPKPKSMLAAAPKCGKPGKSESSGEAVIFKLAQKSVAGNGKDKSKEAWPDALAAICVLCDQDTLMIDRDNVAGCETLVR